MRYFLKIVIFSFLSNSAFGFNSTSDDMESVFDTHELNFYEKKTRDYYRYSLYRSKGSSLNSSFGFSRFYDKNKNLCKKPTVVYGLLGTIAYYLQEYKLDFIKDIFFKTIPNCFRLDTTALHYLLKHREIYIEIIKLFFTFEHDFLLYAKKKNVILVSVPIFDLGYFHRAYSKTDRTNVEYNPEKNFYRITKEEGKKITHEDYCNICVNNFDDIINVNNNNINNNNNKRYIAKRHIAAHVCDNNVRHCFHEDCIQNWLNYKPICPTCRQQILNKTIFGVVDPEQPVFEMEKFFYLSLQFQIIYEKLFHADYFRVYCIARPIFIVETMFYKNICIGRGEQQENEEQENEGQENQGNYYSFSKAFTLPEMWGFLVDTSIKIEYCMKCTNKRFISIYIQMVYSFKVKCVFKENHQPLSLRIGIDFFTSTLKGKK